MAIRRWNEDARLTCMILLLFAGSAAQAAGGVMADIGRQICVGHLMLELPVNAKVSVAGSYRGIQAERRERVGFDSLVDELGARAQRMEARKVEHDAYAAAIYRSGGVDPEGLFGESQLLGFDSDQVQELAVLGYHDKPGEATITVELHRLFDGSGYVFRVDNLGANRYAAVRDSVIRASSRFQPLHKDEAPEGPGFCVGNGLFVEDGVRDVGGDATLVATFPDYPEVSFSVDVFGVAEPSREGGLQSRIDGELGLLTRAAPGARTLRTGPQRYAERDGYLVAISASDEGERVQKFFWSAEGIPGDARKPMLEIQLMAGDSGPSPLDDDELGALWDRLLAGLRQRPGAI